MRLTFIRKRHHSGAREGYSRSFVSVWVRILATLAVHLARVDQDDDRATAMSCWHMLMGKRYSLLAGGSGSTPGTCTPASWTARFSNSFDNAEADAEHEEMVNELQAVVLIGNQWANAEASEQPAAEDDQNLIPSSFDAETATGQCVAEEDDDNWNSMRQSMENDVQESRLAATERTCSVEDDLSNLYSNVVKSTISHVEPSLGTVNSCTSVVPETASSTIDRDEVLPLPVYDGVLQPLRETRPPSPSFSCAGGHHELPVTCSGGGFDNAEEQNEVELHQALHGAGCSDGDGDSASVMRHSQVADDADQQVQEGLAAAAHVGDRDNLGSRTQPLMSSPAQVNEEQQAADVTPRRSSQLSKTLRDNLERLLQRGPVSTTSSYRRRRRRTKRDDGDLATTGQQQTTPSRDGKLQQHRHNHRHHQRHHHHHHHHQQQQQQQQQSEPDDAQSLVTDSATLRSPSATSVSNVSSISDGMFTFFAGDLNLHHTVRSNEAS